MSLGNLCESYGTGDDKIRFGPLSANDLRTGEILLRLVNINISKMQVRVKLTSRNNNFKSEM